VSVKLAMVLVLGVLLAGCGKGSSAPPPVPAATQTTEAPSSASPAVRQAVAACRRTVLGAPLLSSNQKAKLAAVCDKAGNGDLAGAKQAAINVCYDIAGALPQFARAQARAACPSR